MATLPATAGVPRLTSPDRVVYPDAGITKREVRDYYAAVAPRLLRDAGGRLLSVVRCPDGVGGARFFQKHLGRGFGAAIHRRTIAENDGDRAEYFYIDDRDGLLALVQMNAIEFHPWGSKVADLERADRLVFDLDPDTGIDWKTVKAAARALRERLDALGLVSFPRLTGGKGLHVVVPIAPAPWARARAFCESFAQSVVEEAPDRYVATMRKARREGRIFIDWLRNGRGATAIASWSLRARPGAPVALPVDWEELARVRTPDRFRLRDALRRSDKDSWDTRTAVKQSLPRAH